MPYYFLVTENYLNLAFHELCKSTKGSIYEFHTLCFGLNNIHNGDHHLQANNWMRVSNKCEICGGTIDQLCQEYSLIYSYITHITKCLLKESNYVKQTILVSSQD